MELESSWTPRRTSAQHCELVEGASAKVPFSSGCCSHQSVEQIEPVSHIPARHTFSSVAESPWPPIGQRRPPGTGSKAHNF